MMASLFESRDFLRGVPIARDVAARLRSQAWEFDLTFSNLLHNAAMQAGARSSYERVAMMRESFAELDRAEAMALDPRALAEILDWRARKLEVWGFPWETLMVLTRAQRADPSSPAISERAFGYRETMRDPVRREAP